MKNGLAVRLEKINRDSLLVLVRSYVEILTGGGGMMAGAPGNTYWVSTLGGSSLEPDYYIHLLFTERHAEPIATTETKNSISELINVFDSNRNDDTQIVFKKNNETFVGCYDSKNDMYIIKKIKDNP